jgi:hypothetical protein
MWQRFKATLNQFVGPDTTPLRQPPLRQPPNQVAPRVLMIVHNPPVPRSGGRRLNEVFGWNDPDQLARQYIADLQACSGGYLNYQIVGRIEADWFPAKLDGFRYTLDSYQQAWRTRQFHQPDAIDYPAQIATFHLIERFQRDEFDEVWFFAFPYSGDYESTMVGDTAFWCNSPPVTGTPACGRRFVMMAFNYERGVDCMLENFGHRTESIMSRVFETLSTGPNLWEQFTRYDLIAPGRANCGNVHFAPSSLRDYDWGNPRPVTSFCDDWLFFPELPGQPRTVTAREWGGGDMRQHHLWWFDHLPRVAGASHGVAHNWWQYIVDPNLVP